jgi:phosphomannomutase
MVEKKQVVVAVSGYFNPLHKGHVKLFEEAKKLGDKLVVIINSDKQRAIKGSKEFMNESERKIIVEAIRHVDEAIISIDEDGTQCKTLEMLKPDIFANGGDRKAPEDLPESTVCRKNNIELVFDVGGNKVQSSSWLLDSSEIDFSNKKVIIADVDETICESCTEVSTEMAESINNLIRSGYTFAFISGTHVKELLRMISSGVKEKHHLLGTTGTNYTLVENDVTHEIYNFSFSKEEKQDIFSAFEKLINHYNMISMTTKADQLQDRDSQITLSPLGRNAPLKLKKEYDPDGKKRKKYVEYLNNIIDATKFEIKIGGTTSIDITRKGLDKAWGIKKFAEHHNIKLSEILFIGDKIYSGGNDYAASKIVDFISVKNPYETLERLRKFFPNKETQTLNTTIN